MLSEVELGVLLFEMVREAEAGWTFTATLLVLLTILAQRLGRVDPRGARVLIGTYAIHLFGVAMGVLAARMHEPFLDDARLVARLGFSWVALLSAASILFEVALPRLGVALLPLVEDIFVAVTGVVLSAMVASRNGYDLTGIIATSAVVTAVIGLALQDTLGNTLGGLTLQFDGTVRVDDWIKVGDITGRVVAIHWRYTAVETRNWETVLIPNSRLVKESVIVLGRREGQPRQWRRWVWFQVDFRHPPSRVIETVEAALRAAPLPNVASEPQPNCVLMEYGESVARYAVRYWLTDLAADDPTDSAVRLRLYAALERAAVPLALPAHAIFVTEDSHKRRERKKAADHQRRVRALEAVPIFAPLTDEEREFLADALVYAPFAKGEVLTRQGQEAHWLYCVASGRVGVRVATAGLEREVAQLGPGEVFGEMALLTGEPRAASAVALTDVDCWRLDKEAFEEVLRNKPEFAGPIANLLAERRVGLLEAREKLDDAARSQKVREVQSDVLLRMRRFFGLPG